MTEEEIERLEKLCAEATPGPWVSDGDRVRTKDNRPIAMALSAAAPPYGRDMDLEVIRRNCDFLGEARTALPALLAEVRRLRASNALAQQACDALVSVPVVVRPQLIPAMRLAEAAIQARSPNLPAPRSS